MYLWPLAGVMRVFLSRFYGGGVGMYVLCIVVSVSLRECLRSCAHTPSTARGVAAEHIHMCMYVHSSMYVRL